MKFYSILRIKYYIIIQQFVLMILISSLVSFLYAIFECHFFLSVHFSHNSTIIFEHQNILLLHLRFIYLTNHSIHKLLLLNSPNIPFFLLTPSFDFVLLSFNLTNLHFFIRNMQFLLIILIPYLKYTYPAKILILLFRLTIFLFQAIVNH